ncbi:MAG: hypothetical protein JWM90_2912 [Thermoleophilia bacterium]|nr:hypothetical protein [Thermoleophilia bacterium]
MVTYAFFGRRAWGFVLDIVVDLFALWLLHTITGGTQLGLVFLAWYLIHHVGFVMEGGSLGMRLAGLRVVQLDGTRVSFGQALVRELVRVAGSLPSLGLGFLWMLDQPQRRCWHDLAAQTVVVRESFATLASSPSWAAAPPWTVREDAVAHDGEAPRAHP